ncbi:MAG TPA: hypothetical protein VNA25_27165 [Phycisphaerae bacterium]|nr:hypothetical protein [Phycisphaerae bacterium]
MIAYDEFGRLRLAQFMPQAEIIELDDWQFMGRTWVGEAVGFSEWLCLKSEPSVLRSLSLDFSGLPATVAASVLKRLRLPLRARMNSEEIGAALGRPRLVFTFAGGRRSYEYAYGTDFAYSVSCTVHETQGLIDVVVMRPLDESSDEDV